MGKVAPFNMLNPIYEYLPYCVQFIEETNPVTGKRETRAEYLRTYPPFPWKRNGDAHEGEDPIEFIDACANAGLVRWETKEQERERRVQERAYGTSAPVSYEEYLRLKGESV